MGFARVCSIFRCRSCFCLFAALLIICQLVNYLVHLFVQMYGIASERANLPHTVALIRILIPITLFTASPSSLLSLWHSPASFPIITVVLPLSQAPHCLCDAPCMIFLTVLQSTPCYCILLSLCPCLDLSAVLSVCCIECLLYQHLLFFSHRHVWCSTLTVMLLPQ